MEKFEKFKWGLNIIRQLGAIIFLYNVLCLAFSFMWPYTKLQASGLGLSQTDILVISGLVPFLSFPASPVIGFIGDKIGCKVVMTLLFWIVALVTVCMNFIPKYKNIIMQKIEIESVEAMKNDIPGAIRSFAQFKADGFSGDCSSPIDLTISKLICDGTDHAMDYNLYRDEYVNSTHGYCEDTAKDFCFYSFTSFSSNSSMFCDVYLQGEENEFTIGNFGLLFFLYLVCKTFFSFGIIPGWNMVDAVASKRCQDLGVEFSWVMVPGNLGLMVGPLVTGWLMDNIKIGTDKIDCLTQQVIEEVDYTIPFLCCAGFFVLSTLVALLFNINIEPVRTNLTWREELAWVLTPPAIFLYTILLIHGFTCALEEGFFSLFVVEDLGLSYATYGVLSSITMGGGLLKCLMAGLVRKYVGDMNLVLIFGFISTFKVVFPLYLSRYDSDFLPVELTILSLCDGTWPMVKKI